MINIFQKLKQASSKLLSVTEIQRIDILNNIAKELQNHIDQIELENQKDVALAKKNNLSEVIIERLILNESRILSMIKACQEIAAQPAVLGYIEDLEAGEQKRSNGLLIKKQRIPLGMLAMVFESRPNVVIDAMALAIKSGNGLILKGGKEAQYSNRYLFQLVEKIFKQTTNLEVFHYLDSRQEFHDLLTQDKCIDLVIARGGSALVNYVKQNATMPVMCHDKGLCHLYIHHDANSNWVNQIVVNAKASRAGVCNALESLLIHQNYPAIKEVIDSLIQAGVEIRGCLNSQKFNSQITLATEADFDTEYLSKILSLKIVNNDDDAITHIKKYSSHHTEAILAQNQQVIEKFINALDSSCIMVNTTTRFNDGGELGLGAELGISTSKFHAYGPVGAAQMTTMRYVVIGQGQIRQ